MRYLVTVLGEYSRGGYSGSRKAFSPQVDASSPEEAKQKALEIAKRSGYVRCEVKRVETMNEYRSSLGLSNTHFQNGRKKAEEAIQQKLGNGPPAGARLIGEATNGKVVYKAADGTWLIYSAKGRKIDEVHKQSSLETVWRIVLR